MLGQDGDFWLVSMTRAQASRHKAALASMQ